MCHTDCFCRARKSIIGSFLCQISWLWIWQTHSTSVQNAFPSSARREAQKTILSTKHQTICHEFKWICHDLMILWSKIMYQSSKKQARLPVHMVRQIQKHSFPLSMSPLRHWTWVTPPSQYTKWMLVQCLLCRQPGGHIPVKVDPTCVRSYRSNHSTWVGMSEVPERIWNKTNKKKNI